MAELEKILCTDSKVEAAKKINAIVDAMGEGDLANKSLNNLDEQGEKHFLNKSQITNCILEVPQRIKYTLENGTLTIHAGSVVIVPYGTTDRTSEFPVGATFIHENLKVYDTQFADGKFFVWAELVNDVSRKRSTTDTNTRFITFYVRSNSMDGAVNSASGTSTTTTTLFYNTSTNLVEYLNNGANTDSNLTAFPLGISKADGTNIFGSIDQVFNGRGYIGSTLWLDKGVKGLISNGKNGDGTYKSIERTNDRIIVNLLNSGIYNRTNQAIFWDISSNYVSPLGTTFTEDNYTNTAYNLVFDTKVNKYFYSGSSNTYKEYHLGLVIAFCNIDVDSKYISFNPKQPFRAVDYNDFANTPHIVDRYVNGTSWYRVWSDGWIEQGGKSGAATTTVKVSLLKPFTNTNYSVIGSRAGANAVLNIPHTAASKLVNSFEFYTQTAGGDVYWKACGY